MRPCEICGGLKALPRLYHHQRILVRCEHCHGTGLILLGHESGGAYADLEQKAHAEAIRDGWYEEAWEGEHPGRVLKVLRRIGPAEFVQVDRGEVA